MIRRRTGPAEGDAVAQGAATAGADDGFSLVSDAESLLKRAAVCVRGIFSPSMCVCVYFSKGLLGYRALVLMFEEGQSSAVKSVSGIFISSSVLDNKKRVLSSVTYTTVL